MAEVSSSAWFQAYLPGDDAGIEALIDRVGRAGFRTLVITVDTPVAANRENNVRAGFSTPLRPSLRLAWQGVTRPRWLLGTFARTLLRHGMPHFDNNYAARGAPILSPNVERDFSDRGHLTWAHFGRIRRQWSGTLIVNDAAKFRDVSERAVQACDAIDGITDGMIQETRRCKYDASAAVCGQPDASADPAICLTPGEANVVNKIWDGPRSSHGKKLWVGWERGTQSILGITPAATGAPTPFGEQINRYWVHRDPFFNWRSISPTEFASEQLKLTRLFSPVGVLFLLRPSERACGACRVSRDRLRSIGRRATLTYREPGAAT